MAQGHLLVPVVVIFALLLEGFTATYAAIISTAVVIYAMAARALGVAAARCRHRAVGDRRAAVGVGHAVRAGPRLLAAAAGRAEATCSSSPKATVEALRDGAYQTVPVAMATAAAGIMIGIILQTGLAIRFTSFLVDIAGGPAHRRAPHHDGRRRHPRDGAPHHAGLHHAGGAPHPGPHQARRAPAGRPHVRLLLRLPLVGHAAGVPGGVRGGVDQPVQRVGGRLAGDEVRAPPASSCRSSSSTSRRCSSRARGPRSSGP